MVMQRGGSVYILTNQQHSVYYTGVTANLPDRIWQHINQIYPKSFTAKYNCKHLVYYADYPTIEEAITEEKRIKAGSRQSKINLVSNFNPEWKDLYPDLMNG
ncbi:GIY-YIG nuclease family protein [Mucilaginibacter sp.]